MKIIMLKTDWHTIDGFSVEKFIKEQEYKVREFVGCNLINKRSAKLVTDEVQNDSTGRGKKNQATAENY